MVEVTIPIVLQLIQTVALIVGIIYYLIIMRNSQRNQQIQLETRQAQLFMQIYDKFNDIMNLGIFSEVLGFVWEDNDDFWGRFSKEADPEAYRKWNYHAGFLEGIGVLVKRGLIDPEMVDDLMSGSIMMFWERYGPVIIDGRRRLNAPMLWEWVEYLYHEIKRITEEQHGELKDITY